MFRQMMLSLLAGFSFFIGCVSTQHRSLMKEPLVGDLSRKQLEAVFSHGRLLRPGARPDRRASLALAQVPRGALVTVYLGTWCPDSERELARFWQALDALGQDLPFEVRYVGVDREKRAPQIGPELQLRFVPTFVVSREGRELGRVVESAPRGIEVDLPALLSGELQGVISKRADLATQAVTSND